MFQTEQNIIPKTIIFMRLVETELIMANRPCFLKTLLTHIDFYASVPYHLICLGISIFPHIFKREYYFDFLFASMDEALLKWG